MTHDDRKDINAHLLLIDVIKLYSNHIAVHIDASNEIILKEYKKK